MTRLTVWAIKQALSTEQLELYENNLQNNSRGGNPPDQISIWDSANVSKVEDHSRGDN